MPRIKQTGKKTSKLAQQRRKATKPVRKGTISKPTSKSATKTVVAAASAAVPPKKRKWHAGTVALREIKRCQRETGLYCTKLGTERLIRELLEGIVEPGTQMRLQDAAIETLRTAAEDYLVQLFKHTNLVAIHAGREGIQPKDMRLAMELRGDMTCFGSQLAASKFNTQTKRDIMEALANGDTAGQDEGSSS